MSLYLFVTAGLLSVVSLVLIFKWAYDRVLDDPKQFVKTQRKFFIYAALSKIIPVVLIIFGLIHMSPLEKKSLPLPMGIIIAFLIYGLYFISSQRPKDATEDAQHAAYLLKFIARPLLFSIPLMALVFLFLMTGQIE